MAEHARLAISDPIIGRDRPSKLDQLSHSLEMEGTAGSRPTIIEPTLMLAISEPGNGRDGWIELGDLGEGLG